MSKLRSRTRRRRNDSHQNPRRLVSLGLGRTFLTLTALLAASGVSPSQDPLTTTESTWVPPAIRSNYGVRFGGQYRINGQATNFDRHSVFLTNDQSSVSFGALRLRQWFNLFHEERKDHGVYVQLEIGHVFLGEDEDFPKAFDSGGDEVGLELRRGYLWVEPWRDATLRVGVVDWQDRFGDRPGFDAQLWTVDDYASARSVLANSVWDFNVSGLTLDGLFAERIHYRGGLLWLAEGDDTLTGTGAAFLATADVDVEVGSDLFGASLYYLRDNGDYSYGTFGGPRTMYDSSWDLWAGVRGYLDWGDVKPSAYAIFNYGETEEPNWRHHGWAARLAVDKKLDEATISAQVLYSSGDDGSSATRSDEFRTIAQSERDNFGAQGYWSFMGLTSPRGPTDVNDLGVGLQNRGLGLLTAQLAAEVPLSNRWRGYVSTAWLRSAEDNPANGSSDIGWEVLGEMRWKLADSLAIDFGGAFLRTGDFYRAPGGSSPDDLFSLFARMQLEF